MNNVKITRAERPDKAIFLAMTGVFFILFSLPAFYWAFYNFGEYNRTTDFVQELREKPETYLTPNEREEKKNRIASNSSMADRYKLEMFLSGAGGLVLFVIASLLFRNALQARKRKNYYENIDWRTVQIPTERVKIRYKKLYDILFALVILFFGGMLLLIVYQNFTNKFIASDSAILRSLLFGVPVILFLTVFCCLMIRAKRQAVQVFDASGITRGDGRQFAWTEFCGVVTQIAFNQRTRNRYVWRIELAFANGETAWIIPNRIKNAEEVFNYVAALPRAVLK